MGMSVKGNGKGFLRQLTQEVCDTVKNGCGGEARSKRLVETPCLYIMCPG